MSIPTLSVEVAFATDPGSAPTWTDVTPYVRRASIRRGRSHELDRVEAARATVRFRNVDGRFDPTALFSPYTPNVRPMRRIRLRATVAATTYDQFNGYIEAWPQAWSFGPSGDAYVDIRAVDAFKPLALAKISTTRSAEQSGTRVGAILDAAGWPAADRTVDTGISQVQGVTLVDVAALTHLQDVDATEGGLLFASRDGRVVFQDRTKPVTAAPDTANRTWGDGGGFVEKDYVELTTSYDDSQIWNDAKITAPGKTDQTASDATSQTRYFRRTRVEAGLWNDQNEMLSRAQYVVTRFAEPALRIATMDLDARVAEDQLHAIMARDLHDKVRAVKRPTGGGTITQDSFLEGISQDIAPGVWNVEWALSPLDRVTDYWILEDAVQGVLDSTTRLYW